MYYTQNSSGQYIWNGTVPKVDVGTNFYAYIINTGNWMHLTNDSNNVSIRTQTGETKQVWYFERLSDGSYKITSVLDGNCMEVCNFGTTDGTNVQTYGYNGNTAQQWYISGSSGAYVFRAKCASTVLDIDNNSSTEGTNVQMWTYNGTSAQLFTIWKLDDYDTTVPSVPAISLSSSAYGMTTGNCYRDEPITVTWSASNCDYYWLQIKCNEDETYVINQSVGTSTDYTFTPSVEGSYTVAMQSYNEAGSSDKSTKSFNVRGVYRSKWTSSVAMGNEASSFLQGDTVYFNYKLYDKVSGDLLYTYYSNNFPVTLSIIDPNSTTVATKSYTKDDNDYISYKCTTVGTYTAKVDFNGTVSTKTFPVSEKTYTIQYNANGGTGAPASQTKSYGVNLKLSTTVSTRTGYTFPGWSTSSSATRASYQPGGTFTTNADTTLYAVWQKGCSGSHSYSYKVTTAPTTSASGTLTGTCSNCSATTTVTLPKLNTTDYTYQVVTAATCTANGTGRYTWNTTTYGTFYFDVTINKTGHSYASVVTAPTCTEDGYTTYTCTRCDSSYSSDTVPATGHSFGEWVTVKAPTFTKEGLAERRCTVCNAVESRTPEKRKNPFVDVKEGQYFYQPVLWAVENGITNGVDETHFAPFDSCTRGQVVTFLWRANGCPEPTATQSSFSDVAEGKYYTKAVLWAAENGITTGNADGTFAPNATVTRAQFVTFLWRALGKQTPSQTSSPFPDVPDGKYYTAAVIWAAENGITTGNTDGTFAPDATCTRGQVVTFLYRAYSEQ